MPGKEGVEIDDNRPFEARSGQSFLFQVWRPLLNVWDTAPPGPDEAEDADDLNMLQIARGGDTISTVIHVKSPPSPSTAIRLIAFGCLEGMTPDYIEVQAPVSSENIQAELWNFGITAKATILDSEFAALCVSTNETFLAPFWIFVNTTDPTSHTFHVVQPPAEEQPSLLSWMKSLYKLGFEKAVVLHHVLHSEGSYEVHFCETHGHFETKPVDLRVQKAWPQPQQRVPISNMIEHFGDASIPKCLLDLGISQDSIQSLFQTRWELCTIIHDLDLPDCSRSAFLDLESASDFDRLCHLY